MFHYRMENCSMVFPDLGHPITPRRLFFTTSDSTSALYYNILWHTPVETVSLVHVFYSHIVFHLFDISIAHGSTACHGWKRRGTVMAPGNTSGEWVDTARSRQDQIGE